MLRTFTILAALALAGCNDKDAVESAAPVNNAPTAAAGHDQLVPADQQVDLDGSGSFDPDGDPLTFHWTFEYIPEGSTITSREAPFSDNHSSTASRPTFIPDVVGTYVISLWVTDGPNNSPKDYVVVSTDAPISVPVADAGVDQMVSVGDTVTFDGSGSYDPQGRALTYTWHVVDVPELSAVTDSSVTGADTIAPTLAIDARGVYVLNLAVNNGLTSSLADAVVITALGNDNSPVANAGLDMSAEDCTAIQLDGSGSADPDGDTLSYFWELQSKPSNSAANNSSFSDRRAERPTFFADQMGTYVVSLAVSDGSEWSAPHRITLAVSDRSYNSEPVVTINTWATVDAGEAVCSASGYTYNCDDCSDATLEDWGSNVTIVDADNDPYTLVWEMTDGDGNITSPEELVTRLRLENIEASEPGVCDTTEFDMRLTVTDCVGAVVQASSTISAQCCGVEETDSAN